MPYDLTPDVTSWIRSIRARNLSPSTDRVYARAGHGLAAYLAEYEPADDGGRTAPDHLAGIHREHIEGYITTLIDRTSPATAHQYFRSLKTFFNWLVEEEELDRSPMRTMRPPEVPEVEVPVIAPDAVVKLLKTCSGKAFEDRRDTAIIMAFYDTGGRLSEITDRDVGKLDLDVRVLHIVGKGRRQRPAPFGHATAVALDRYLRAYAKHIGRPLREDDPLWIGVKTRRAFTIWGVGTMIKRRCVQAGLPDIHPHQFRHTLAHLWKLSGGGDDELMRIMGWRSRQMLNRYGASAGQERAREAHQRLSPGDRLQGR